MELVAALRKHTDAVFRVDANAGWTLEEALKKIPLLKDLGVEFIEPSLFDSGKIEKIKKINPSTLLGFIFS